MAKGSAMGLWRGKKGTSVFYKITNSNDAQKQGIRERVYKIKNPQTAAQLNQRMKQVPTQRIAGALDEVIKRSFEGVEYGAKSRQEFLKYALSMPWRSKWPKVDRTETRPVPGEYLISKGSLDGFPISPSAASGTILLEQLTTGIVDTPETIGDLSALILANNANFKAGDQLTFVVCMSAADIPEEAIEPNYYRWSVTSFYLNEADTTPVNDWAAGIYNGCNLIVSRGQVELSFDNDYPCAAAVIVSRLSGTNKYLRSTATIEIDETLLAPWFTTGREDLARASYMKTQSRSTNWPVDTDAGAGTGGRTTSPASYTITGMTGAAAAINNRNVWVRRYDDDGSLAAVYITDNSGETGGGPKSLIDRATNTPLQYAVDMVPTFPQVSEIPALATLRQIEWTGVPQS